MTEAAPAAAAATPALRLLGIGKSFGPLRANDDITLDLARGEVLALLGENGAGKSTLVSILFGHYVAEQGHIEVEGQRLPPGQPQAALKAGIGMVHQHFTLAENLSVLDNVMLGTESLWRLSSKRSTARRRLLDEAARFGLQVNPDARVADLAIGERQRVEILKALVRGARILILDEPTAVLTPPESKGLFAVLRSMVAQGLSIVFISHKLTEVLRVSHRIAVLRAGRVVWHGRAADASAAVLAEAMVGRAVGRAQRGVPTEPGPVVCELQQVRVRGRAGAPPLQDANLQVRGGEVVAVAGVSGNGQATLAALLFGECAAEAGRLLIGGRVLPAQPAAFVATGVARVPEDRHAVGAVADLTLWENAVLERYRDPAFAPHFGILRRGAAMAWAAALLQRFDVRGTEARGLLTTTRRLSGGNLQKLLLGRVLMPPPGGAQVAVRSPAAASADSLASGVDAAGVLGTVRLFPESIPKLIVVQQPTWGLDVGAVAAVHQQLLDAAAAGAAVIVISEDLDEVYALADRIAVMHRGHLSAAEPRAAWSRERIGLAMAGAIDPANPAEATAMQEPADAAA